MNQAEVLFLLFQSVRPYNIGSFYDVKYDSSNNPARQRQGTHNPTYGPPTRKVAHPRFMQLQSLNIQNSKECRVCRSSVRDGEKVTARFSSCNYTCQNMAVITHT